MMRALSVLPAILCVAGVLAASGPGTAAGPRAGRSAYEAPGQTGPAPEQPEVLWVYDEDFDDPFPNDWTVLDMSGTVAQDNYWHIDTIRPKSGLGDHSMWCGTYNSCWSQPRGYADYWHQVLTKEFLNLAGGAGTVILDFDQRFAMERDYDYGYLDVNSGTGWVTLATYNNVGTLWPGTPVDWDDATYGHQSLDISSYSGADVTFRFRFESDGAYSSADQTLGDLAVTDGAWQFDNFQIHDGARVDFFFDDFEGTDTWTHDPTPGGGQTGIAWWRGQYGIDFWTGRAIGDSPAFGTWMYAAMDPASNMMVDYQDTWLLSPPISIGGGLGIVAEWDICVDLPAGSNDYFDLWLAAGDDINCVGSFSSFRDEDPGAWYGGPFWGTWTDDWRECAGNEWLAVGWRLWNEGAPGHHFEHMSGVFLGRLRVGLLTNTDTVFDRDIWNSLHDWFAGDLPEALVDTALIRVCNCCGIDEVRLRASNDGGATWDTYACSRSSSTSDWWRVRPPISQMAPGSEILYYYEAVDLNDMMTTYPEGAPDESFEFSILPIKASLSDPGILLVDKHGRRVPGEDRAYRRTSEDYYREMLEILGYEWETYDVEVPSGTILSLGPDTALLRYYHTAIYFTNDLDAFTLWGVEQCWLLEWLVQALDGKERNLLLTGNDIAYELNESDTDTLNFYDTWLGALYLGEVIGHGEAGIPVDRVPGLMEAVGGWTFMDHADTADPASGECILAGERPDPIENFDIIEPALGTEPECEIVAYHLYDGCAVVGGAGVAYTHPAMDYQTVILGFGMEFMMDGVCGAGPANFTPAGHYYTGIADRVNLMANIMGYFDVTPSGPPLGVAVDGCRNTLSQAYPNPFNPATQIRYSVKEAGPVTIEVYNVAGRVVRTLLDEKVDAGTAGSVMWDGTDNAGERCASGVYFYSISASGFSDSKKMVVLK